MNSLINMHKFLPFLRNIYESIACPVYDAATRGGCRDEAGKKIKMNVANKLIGSGTRSGQNRSAANFGELSKNMNCFNLIKREMKRAGQGMAMPIARAIYDLDYPRGISISVQFHKPIT